MNTQTVIRRETRLGEQITIGSWRITPQSEVVELKRGFLHLVWNRPAALLVEQGNELRQLPILDLTRIMALGLSGLAALMTLATMMMFLKLKKVKK